jgi:DNA polymerase
VSSYPITQIKNEDVHAENIPANNPAAIASVTQDPQRELALAQLHASIADCALCAIAKDRTHLVFGQGNASARLMIIGEGPGEQEDLQGIAFCGKSGELLTKMLAAIQLSRDEVYIANVIKCRPPHNRNPLPEEIMHCRVWLDKQIDIVQPELICTAGNVPTKTLLDTQVGIMRLRGTLQEYRGIPVIPTYHPSFLLRDPTHKKDAWKDLQRIQYFLREGGHRKPAKSPEGNADVHAAARMPQSSGGQALRTLLAEQGDQ